MNIVQEAAVGLLCNLVNLFPSSFHRHYDNVSSNCSLICSGLLCNLLIFFHHPCTIIKLTFSFIFGVDCGFCEALNRGKARGLEYLLMPDGKYQSLYEHIDFLYFSCNLGALESPGKGIINGFDQSCNCRNE